MACLVDVCRDEKRLCSAGFVPGAPVELPGGKPFSSIFAQSGLLRVVQVKPCALFATPLERVGGRAPQLAGDDFCGLCSALDGWQSKTRVTDTQAQAEYPVPLPRAFSWFANSFKQPPPWDVAMPSRRLSVLSLDLFDAPGDWVKANFRAPDFIKYESLEEQFPDEGCTEPGYRASHFLQVCAASQPFHVDFSGTTTFLYMLKGRKVVLCAQPTRSNIELITRYRKALRGDCDQMAATASDLLWPCGALEGPVHYYQLAENDFVVLPGGLLHAVVSLEPSISYTGNFVHPRNIERQCLIWQADMKWARRARITDSSFPGYMWKVGAVVLRDAV
ncbi:Lysine-specific demethylase 2A [Cryptotrichosporon argae]